MDLVTLWEHVPLLLSACVRDGNDVLRQLRLVSKEASRIALQALVSFDLNLNDPKMSRIASWARLLQKTQLQSMNVRLLLSARSKLVSGSHPCAFIATQLVDPAFCNLSDLFVEIIPIHDNTQLDWSRIPQAIQELHASTQDSISPFTMLQAFVQEIGASLHTVIGLSLHVENLEALTGVELESVQDESMGCLFSSCPALRSLTLHGSLSPALLRILGEACPLLFSLTITGASESDYDYLQDTLLELLPTLVPQISSLSFQNCMPDFGIPDMSQHPSLKSINLPGCKIDACDWSSTPQTLVHFCCQLITEGPSTQAMEFSTFFPNLLSLEAFGHNYRMPCHVLAQLLRAAPALEHLLLGREDDYDEENRLSIVCKFSESSADTISADFEVLVKAMHTLSTVKDAQLYIDCSEREIFGEASLLTCIASLPYMSGAAEIKLVSLEAGELGPMLTRFPDVSDLILRSLHDMTDIELQDVAACLHLTTLTIVDCDLVSPMGLLSLCLLCPGLNHVWCSTCAQLEDSVLDECMHLLQRHGLNTSLIDTTGCAFTDQA